MTKWSTYPQYKHSGTDWLGEIPVGWNVARARRILRQVRESARPDDEQLAATQRYGVIPQRKFMEEQDQKVVLALSGTSNFRHVEKDDFVISLRSFQGGIERCYYNGCVSPAYTVMRPEENAHPAYLGYLLKSYGFISVLQSVTQGIREGKTITYDQFGGIDLPIPSQNEQAIIADFLDHETTKIDHLIAKQERLIELLKEKRQAVISHAVTKGLNPDAPMKDSGVEWLGEVPVHWEVARLKHVAILQSGVAKGRNLSGAKTIQVPYLRVANVQDGYLDLDDVARIELQTEELTRYLLRDGDVLMNEGGDNDKLGRGAVWRNQISPCVHQNHVFAIRPQRVEPEWLTLVTRTHYAKFYFFRVSKQSTNLASISSTNIKETPLVVPPKKERREIMNYVDKMSDKYQRIQDLAEQQVALLKEHRTALISAAVTGKIDVRDWKKPEQQPQQTAKTATG